MDRSRHAPDDATTCSVHVHPRGAAGAGLLRDLTGTQGAQRGGSASARPATGSHPPFDDGTRIAVRGDRLIVEPDLDVPITPCGRRPRSSGSSVARSRRGSRSPAVRPRRPLDVDPTSSLWLGTWYTFGARHLDGVVAERPDGTVDAAQLWPEHFDLAVVVELAGQKVNVGFSPGDRAVPGPYVYVGPPDTSALDGDYWNAPFGAVLRHGELRVVADPDPHDDGVRRCRTADPRRPAIDVRER